MTPGTTTDVDLVLFTCEGRERLLLRTLASFHERCDYRFRRRILAVDGPFAPEAIAAVQPDLLVQNRERRGYVVNILNALPHVESNFFFWLEDDWSFARELDITRAMGVLGTHVDWVQVRYSKSAPLNKRERSTCVHPCYFASAYGFSTNPSLNRTALVRNAFEAVVGAPRDGVYSHENVASDWCARVGYTCMVEDPGDEPPVRHEGEIESTPRQFHMTASLDGQTGEHLFSLGRIPPFWRRLLLAAKLIVRSGAIAARQLRDDAAYEIAFRIVALRLPRSGGQRRRH